MVSLIVGNGPLLTSISGHVPPERWRVPAGTDPTGQAHWLARHPVPPGKRGFVFTDQAAQWAPVQNAGWIIYWCDASREPVGTEPLPTVALQMPITDMARRFWGVSIPDRRIVSDVMLGHLERTGTLLTVTSNTGGVGKTVTSRRLAERAAQAGLRTLLIDGNMRQSSQRSFFDPTRSKPLHTIFEWVGDNPLRAANQGRTLGVNYDISFAPPTGTTVSWRQYTSYIREARKHWQFIVLDLDRISAADLEDEDTAAGSIVVPQTMAGDPVLVIVKAGIQTQGDALGLLMAMPQAGIPRECVGIKDTIPVGMRQQEYQRLDYSRYGMFLGTEFQSESASAHIAAGQSGWSDPGLDHVREQVLAWALPDVGFDPSKVKEKQKGWKL